MEMCHNHMLLCKFYSMYFKVLLLKRQTSDYYSIIHLIIRAIRTILKVLKKFSLPSNFLHFYVCPIFYSDTHVFLTIL